MHHSVEPCPSMVQHQKLVLRFRLIMALDTHALKAVSFNLPRLEWSFLFLLQLLVVNLPSSGVEQFYSSTLVSLSNKYHCKGFGSSKIRMVIK